VKPYFDDGQCVIYHGDCREILPGLRADLVLTDPPYGVGIDYGAGSDDSIDAAKRLYVQFIDQATVTAAITLTTVGCYALELFLYANRPPKWRLCWRKGITSRPSAVGFTDWEPVFVYGDKVHRNSHDLFTVQPERMGAYGHPCPKPDGFGRWLVSRFCDVGGTVLDPFMGSGTTLRAAKDLGRRAIGIEIEERYCAIAAKRLEQQVLTFEERIVKSGHGQMEGRQGTLLGEGSQK
jgi:site-specific DNA-methyltransferase (adenine-specific)